MPTGGAGGIAGSPGSDRVIVTGVKPMGADAGAAKPVSQYCLRQPNSMLRLMLCRRATPWTVWPSTKVSATSARFASSLHRRRSWPRISSTTPPADDQSNDPSLDYAGTGDSGRGTLCEPVVPLRRLIRRDGRSKLRLRVANATEPPDDGSRRCQQHRR